MIIVQTGQAVGTLHSDGSIESQQEYLSGLNEFWQREGIFTMCPAEDQEEGTTTDGAKVVKPSEDIQLVIDELNNRGYQVIGG